MRLAVVEDNLELAQLLTQGLKAERYDTDLFTTAADARAGLSTTRYAALILDLGLPDGDGLAILREIRQRSDPLPVLVLTARGGVQDRVTGLRCCAVPANCSDARSPLPISSSTLKADRHSLTTSPRSCPPVRWQCWSF